MINTQHSNNGSAASGSTAPPAHNKQPSMAPKKTALRDLQNENAGTTQKQQNGLLLGKLNGANENVMNARRRFELELGRGKLQNNIERFSELKNIGNANRAPVPISSGKNGSVSGMAAANAVPSEVARAIEPKVTGEQARAERFVRLQKFLKQCDETRQIEYTQRLLRLSPSELSKHAVELEKRAIQLTIEEGVVTRNEMQRMKTLNILAKSSPANNLLQSNQLLPPHKR
ncbi:integral membrane protein hemolysin-III homolog [Striga asiatica]|uniref:Integral membrane protein hemolysin-III homolog n=1 Tax=Striga asiatica TaxID=4170 RepID=A0A5A7QFW3_STRAF|nr:integral membrane protein hemolysin-III homolog [Striga asiatica]